MIVETSLAIDMALRTGWAFGSYLGPERWGAWDVSDVEGMAPRFLAWRAQLRKVLEETSPSGIWLETPHGHSGNAVTLSRGWFTIVLLEVAARGLTVEQVPASSLKKAITGNGRAGKHAMRDHAQAMIGDRAQIGEDWDLADALCLLDHGTRTRKGLIA